jgi:hypothetical protein
MTQLRVRSFSGPSLAISLSTLSLAPTPYPLPFRRDSLSYLFLSSTHSPLSSTSPTPLLPLRLEPSLRPRTQAAASSSESLRRCPIPRHHVSVGRRTLSKRPRHPPPSLPRRSAQTDRGECHHHPLFYLEICRSIFQINL